MPRVLNDSCDSLYDSLVTAYLTLLGEAELLLVDLDGLLVAVHLDQDVPHVGQSPELGLAVLRDLGDG